MSVAAKSEWVQPCVIAGLAREMGDCRGDDVLSVVLDDGEAGVEVSVLPVVGVPLFNGAGGLYKFSLYSGDEVAVGRWGCDDDSPVGVFNSAL